MPVSGTSTTAAILREQQTGLQLHIIPRLYNDLSIMLHPIDDESPASMFRRLAEVLQSHGATVLRQAIFGHVGRGRDIFRDLENICGPVEWPVTWIQGGSCGRSELAGIIVKAVTGADVTRIQLDGRPVGSIVENHYARYCHLADIRATDTSAPKPVQARETFEQMRAALAVAEMRLTDIVRTWLCLDDILDWYDEFNEVRTAVFREHGVFNGVVPASTGIGGPNARGAAMIADAFAILPKHASVRCMPIPSPLQCPAIDYGSSFSRATELIMPDYRFLYISGTASIDALGRTLYTGDMHRQVEHTFRVIDAILQSRGMTFADVTRGIAYCRYRGDAAVYQRFCMDHGYDALPVIVAESTVCRDDLLFELQVDSVAPAGNNRL